MHIMLAKTHTQRLTAVTLQLGLPLYLKAKSQPTEYLQSGWVLISVCLLLDGTCCWMAPVDNCATYINQYCLCRHSIWVNEVLTSTSLLTFILFWTLTHNFVHLF